MSRVLLAVPAVTNAVINKATYITLPFIPSPQGRGNITPLSPGGRGRG